MPEGQPDYTPEIEAEKTNDIEAEQTPEDIDHFDVAVILGAGTRPDSEGGMTKLSVDSKLRTISAGILATQGKVGELILTGGKTAGPDNPSEAELMKQYLLKKFPNLDSFPVIIEDSSFDTVENAKLVTEMLGENYQGSVLLITNDYHMLRARRNFEHHGLEIIESPAENIITNNSAPRYKTDGLTRLPDHREEFIRKYLNSCDMKKKRIVEDALRAIMKIDPDGKMITSLAHILRHGNEINEES